MGETISPPVSVGEARRRLADTRRLSSEMLDEAHKALDAFHAMRPRRPCHACGCMVWGEHTAATGEPSWACQGCHRPATLTIDEWRAQRAAEEGRRVAAVAREAAATPEPRQHLADALTHRSEATAVVDGLERAQPAARTALAAAQTKFDDAVVGMRAAEQAAIERAAGQRTARSDLPVDSARGKLRLCEDSLQAARGASALLSDKLHYARENLRHADVAVCSAALRVIGQEELETLIAAAVEARAAYLEAIGCLSWLIRNHCVPNGDVRPHQLVRGADAPPSQWPEATSAGERLAARLAELEAGT